MVNVNHSSLTDPYLHEPKGAAGAAENTVYVRNAAVSGSLGDWRAPVVHGGWRYTNNVTGTTFTSTSYTPVNMAGGAAELHEFTYNNAGVLTYTGAANRSLHGVVDITFKHSSGSGVDTFFSVYKNGSQLMTGAYPTEVIQTSNSGAYNNLAFHFNGDFATNDYYDIRCKSATGTITIYSIFVYTMGVLR